MEEIEEEKMTFPCLQRFIEVLGKDITNKENKKN